MTGHEKMESNMAAVRDLDTQFHQWTGKPDRTCTRKYQT